MGEQPEFTRAWVLHPDIKSNPDRREAKFALAEAVSLAHALPELEVVGSEIVPLPRVRAGLLSGLARSRNWPRVSKTPTLSLS